VRGARLRYPVLLALLACDPNTDSALAPAPLGGRLLASDLAGNQWLTTGTDGAVDSRYTLDAIDSRCQGKKIDPYCLAFQAQRRAAHDGADEVVFTWSILDSSDGSDDQATDLIGQFAAVDFASREQRWLLSALDFSQLGRDAGCPFDPADPCTVPGGLDTAAYWRCQLHMPHDIVIASESEAGWRGWIADTRNTRLLEVELPRGETCGVVRALVGENDADWSLYESPNALAHGERDGVPFLLVSLKSTHAEGEEAAAQLAGAGKGKIAWWEERDGRWTQAWEFPPEVQGAESFVNTPHGVQLLHDADGNEVIAFAHSLGAHDEWSGVTGEGTVGVIRVVDGAAEYLGDLRFPGKFALGFSRDVSETGDGRWIVADSGCLSDPCDRPARSWVIDAPSLSPSGKSGAYSVDHAQQDFVDPGAIDGPYLEGEASVLYSVEWMAE